MIMKKDMKTIEEINQHNVKQRLSEKKIPDFYPGDVVKVGVINLTSSLPKVPFSPA